MFGLMWVRRQQHNVVRKRRGGGGGGGDDDKMVLEGASRSEVKTNFYSIE